MFLNRIIGGCLAVVSLVMLGMAMSSLRGGSGIQVMDRMGLAFVLALIAAQAVILLLFINPKERLVPVLLFAGGTVVYMTVLKLTGGGSSLMYALYAGSAFSGLSIGTLAVMGGKGS